MVALILAESLRIDSTGKATFAEKLVIDGDGGTKYFAVGDNEDLKLYHDANGRSMVLLTLIIKD